MTDNIKYNIVDSDDSSLFESSSYNVENNEEKAPETNNISGTIKSNSSFHEKVNDYVSKNKPKLYILTPCYGSQCFVNYVTCLISTMELFRSVNFPLKVEFCRNDSLVSRARNNLIAKALSDPEMTHVLFIDSDITWNPVDILKLVIADKHLIGGVYPLKHYNWGKLLKDPMNPYNSNIIQSWINKKNGSNLKNIVSDENIIQHNLLSYNINYHNNILNIENNLARVKHIATGFMLIQRFTLEKMILAFPSTKYVDDVYFLQEHENKYAYALFDCGVEEGHYFSEDWLFCHRWTKMGGEIYIDVSINLTHTGIEDFQGCYISSVI